MMSFQLEEDEVLTRPPSPKRAKTERETSSAAGSNSGEADDMNEETGDEDRMKKVGIYPFLKIRLFYGTIFCKCSIFLHLFQERSCFCCYD